ncbi:MAG: redoxin family protein [Pseudomonadota bacterium]
MNTPSKAPALQVSRWFNTSEPLELEALRGKVVVLTTFQLLCPGCVSYGMPQAKKIRELFFPEDLVVIGLHTVFEHHEAQGPATLEAFLSENGIDFPVGVDKPSFSGNIPQTMAAYGLQGTPSLILIDRKGMRRAQHFGQVPELAIGAELGTLIAERELRIPNGSAA